jgi:cation-transporting ATPase E
MQVDDDGGSATTNAGDRSEGLTGAEVAQRVAGGQTNRAVRSSRAEYQEIVARNVLTLFNALVVPAAVALFLLGEYRGAWAVSALAVVNTLVGLVQEIRAKRHLDQLALLTAPRARVVRDGAEQTIAADDVVLGDCVVLAAGDMVVADGVILAEAFLEIDEALLTGESDPVSRRVGERLLSGSVCVAGDGRYRVEKVGGESFANQTAAQARRYRHAPSPMQRALDTLVRLLSAAAVLLCVAYVGLFFVRGFPQAELWQMIAATVTSMVPQGLVLMATLAFSVAAIRMSGRGAVVQRLNAVESMASVDVLCLDKTGTLTTGQLLLDQVRVLRKSEDEARRRLRLFAWAPFDTGNKVGQALRASLGPLPGETTPELLDQLPFKSRNRCSAARLRVGTEERVLVLGAFEALKPSLPAEEAASVEAIWRELLPTGLRLLLFAEATLPATDFNGSLPPGPFHPLALVALRDELRPAAGDVLEALAAQGIRFKIISGDHPETVRAAIQHLKLPLAHESVMTGDRLENDADRAAILDTSSVFGRVSPAQKLAIIDTLRAQGHHVAMIGDGINDILAIKQADLGIAMGAGSAAARAVAGLVLENNDFALLPATLEEGRILLRNLRRAAKLFLLKNFYTLVLIVFALGLFDLGFPYLPQQVTLLNALTIGGPALLLLLNRAPGEAKSETREAGFLREVVGFAAGAGLVVGAAGLAVWLLSAGWRGDDPPTQRTLLLSALVLIGLANVLAIDHRDPRLRVWVAAALPAYLAVMYVPPTAYFFVLVPLTVGQWLFVAAAALPTALVCRWLAQRTASR